MYNSTILISSLLLELHSNIFFAKISKKKKQIVMDLQILREVEERRLM